MANIYYKMIRDCKNCYVKDLNSLKKLSPEELGCISSSKKSLIIKRGNVLFSEGTTLNGVYCILKGECKLTKLAPNGKEQIVKFIRGGEIVGHRSVLSGSLANLTVTALDDVEACFIPKEEILTSFKKNSNFSLEITKSICDDLTHSNIALSNMAQKNVRERLAEALLTFERTFGTNDQGFINILLTREEIANAIGTATESAIRLISDFKKEGLIEINSKHIKLLNNTKLKQISDTY